MMLVYSLVVLSAVCARPASGLLVGSSSVLGATSSRGSSQGTSVSKWKVQGQVNLLVLTDDNDNDDDVGPTDAEKKLFKTLFIVGLVGIVVLPSFHHFITKPVVNHFHQKVKEREQLNEINKRWNEAVVEFNEVYKLGENWLQNVERPQDGKFIDEIEAAYGEFLERHDSVYKIVEKLYNSREINANARIKALNSITKEHNEAQLKTEGVHADLLQQRTKADTLLPPTAESGSFGPGSSGATLDPVLSKEREPAASRSTGSQERTSEIEMRRGPVETVSF